MELEISERCEALIGELARLTAAANRRHRGKYIYAFRYDYGAWIHVTRRDFAFAGYTDIVAQDTRATEENLQAAVAAMRNEIKENNV
jgi:hypothetical protein